MSVDILYVQTNLFTHSAIFYHMYIYILWRVLLNIKLHAVHKYIVTYFVINLNIWKTAIPYVLYNLIILQYVIKIYYFVYYNIIIYLCFIHQGNVYIFLHKDRWGEKPQSSVYVIGRPCIMPLNWTDLNTGVNIWFSSLFQINSNKPLLSFAPKSTTVQHTRCMLNISSLPFIASLFLLTTDGYGRIKCVGQVHVLHHQSLHWSPIAHKLMKI